MNFFKEIVNNNSKRIVGLDIMRSIAILSVVYGHVKGYVPSDYRELYLSLRIIKIDGVSIFFVLSGFLIGGILLKIISTTDFSKNDLWDFWIRRWFRTIPNYLLILVVLLLLKSGEIENIGSTFLKFALFVQNLFTSPGSFFPESWSLTIEEWFYLLFPLLIFIFIKLFKNKTGALLMSTIVFLIVPLALRIAKYEMNIGTDDFDMEFRKVMILRLDSIMYGVFAAYIKFIRPQWWLPLKKPLLVVGVLLIIMLYINPYDWKSTYPPLIFNVESLTSLCFLPFLSSYKSTNFKRLDHFFIFVSVISYSLYLVNLSLVRWTILPVLNGYMISNNVGTVWTFFINYTSYWIFTFAISIFLYKYYERPFTDLREKFSSPRNQSLKRVEVAEAGKIKEAKD